MKVHAFKMYHPRGDVEALETHGQSWLSDTMEDNIALCASQTIEPVFNTYLPKDGKILEAGCGLGRWVIYYRQKGYDIIGIDLAKDAVAMAKSYDPSIPLYIDNILKANYPDGHFKAVISLGVVEHFEEGPFEALNEAHRLLAKDGLLFISVPLQNTFRRLLINHLKRFKMFLQKRKGRSYVFEEYRYTQKQMEDILRQTGFEIIETAADDFFPPKNMGLYVDLPFLRNKEKKWELNLYGRLLRRIFDTVSPRLACAGLLWVCRKK